MRTPTISVLAALAYLLVVSGTRAASAQNTRRVTGTVSDSGGRGIPYVNIDGGPRFRVLSNAVGEFTLDVPARQSLELAVRRIGFLPGKLLIQPGGDTTVNVELPALAVLMETQVIRAREQVRALAARGFYDRMAQQQNGPLVGEFITPEEIELRNPQRVTQLLEQRRGLWVKRVGGCQIITQCWRILGANDCAATVYLDGHRMNRLADAAAAGAGSAPAVDELISATSVSAIEVYPRGSSAPPRFQSLAGTCAVVVIWTR